MTTIGIALIARNEEKNLARLLPTVREHVDELLVVDTGSEDNTVRVAEECGARVEHFAWIDDFAEARNYAFDLLTTDWRGWLDCDDRVEGYEKARDLLQTLDTQNSDIQGVWARYFYDRTTLTDGTPGPWTSVLKRERFVKAESGFRWVGRIHEHMDAPTPVPMVWTPDLTVYHEYDPAKGLQRAYRNLRILHKARHETPNEARTYFDLGWQYHNALRYDRALVNWRKYITFDVDPVTRYQALHKIADCYRILVRQNPRFVEMAEEYDQQAVRFIPEWSDAWYGLAEIALMRAQAKRSLLYTEDGRRRENPNELLVLNPLDYDFHPMMVAQKAHAILGNIKEALKLVEQCLLVVPGHPEACYAKGVYENFLKDEDTAKWAIGLAASMTPETSEKVYWTLPPLIRRKRPVRDGLISPVISTLAEEDVAIYCGGSIETWGPETPTTVGIGGSETAVVEIARRMGERGVNVAVYNHCEEHEGRYGNVRYVDFDRFDPSRKRKLFVGWRDPGIADLKAKADITWLWMHDLHAQDQMTEKRARGFDAIRPVSAWHGQYLRDLYPFLTAEQINPTRNGIDLARFQTGEVPARSSHRAVWCSSPDRGLEHLLAMWPFVRRFVEDAELRILYGWNNWDRFSSQNPGMQNWKQAMLTLGRQPGITWVGRLNQLQVADELRQAQVLAYSSSFLEVSCIASMEAMAAGAVVLSTVIGALPETTQDAALLVMGHPASEGYRKVFAKDVAALMTMPEEAEKWRVKGYERAKALDWSPVADEWIAQMEAPVAVVG